MGVMTLEQFYTMHSAIDASCAVGQSVLIELYASVLINQQNERLEHLGYKGS